MIRAARTTFRVRAGRRLLHRRRPAHGSPLLLVAAVTLMTAVAATPGAAQDLKITFTEAKLGTGFPYFTDPYHLVGRNLVTREGVGPGSVYSSMKGQLVFDAALLELVHNLLRTTSAPTSLLSMFTRADLTATIDLAGSSHSSDAYGPKTATCYALYGDVVQILSTVSPTQVASIVQAIGQLIGAVQGSTFDIHCNVSDKRTFNNIPKGTSQETDTLAGSVAQANYLEVAVGPPGAVLNLGADVGALIGRSGSKELRTRVVFECTRGLVWSDLDNKCICDTARFPQKNPVGECSCEEDQIRDQHGDCADCPPGYQAIGNECVEIDPNPPLLLDCNDYPSGSPEYCALCPNTGACYDCDWLPDENTLRCESKYEFTFVAGNVQALLDCLYLDFTRECLWFQRLKMVPPGDPIPPHDSLTACSEGLGWTRCPDGNPNVRELIPEDSHLDLFPDCFFASNGTQITPCGESFPGGTNRPDLVVASAEIVTTHPVAGAPLAVRFTIANHGTEPAPSTPWMVQVRWTGDARTFVGTTGSLAPGASRTETVTSDQLVFVPEARAYTYEVTADQNASLAELDENNNRKLVAVHVGEGSIGTGGPDLLASAAGVIPARPMVGTAAQLFVTVSNVGDTSSPESRFEATFIHPDGSMSPWSGDLPPLLPGQAHTESFLLVDDRDGAHVLRFEADSQDSLVELDEGNNLAEQVAMVQPTEPCLPCTSGAPNNLVGATQCFESWDGIPHEGGQYRCIGVRPDGTTCAPDGDHPNGWFGIGLRCPDASTLCAGSLHPDRCGIPDICPGTMDCGT